MGSCILRSDIHEFIVIILGLLQVTGLYRELTELVEQPLSHWRPLKGQKEFVLGLIILSVLLIDR